MSEAVWLPEGEASRQRLDVVADPEDLEIAAEVPVDLEDVAVDLAETEDSEATVEPAAEQNDPFASEEDTVAARQERRDAESIMSADPVRAYMKRIGKVALLNAEEEVELSKRIEAGLYAEQLISLREHKSDNLAETDIWKTTFESKYKVLSKGAKTPEQLEVARVQATREADEEIAALLKHQPRDEQHKHAVALRDLRLVARDGERAKNHLLEANLRLVVSLAKRYTGHGMGFLDLIQEGNMGLIRAVEKFDYAKGYKFSTYATWWIRQAIQRGIADKARAIRIPVYMVESINKMGRIQRELLPKLGREPTPEELAGEMDMPADKVLELQHYAREPISLDQSVGDEGDAPLGDFIEDSEAVVAVNAVSFMLLQGQLQSVLQTLTEREAGIVRLRFGLTDGQPRTLDEIGQVYGVTRERIRQIEKLTMTKLRHPSRSRKLEGYLGE